MHRPVFAANWKMNHGPTEARAFVTDFIKAYAARRDRTVIFFPPALTLQAFVDARGTRSDLAVGVQNIWTEDKGPFTGENSAAIAHDAGAKYALIGHSERRHVFGETDTQTAKKCAAAVRGGLVPILCVGEKLEQRDAGKAESVVAHQLKAGLSQLTPDVIKKMAIAYEPVWAIGTGHTATPSDASHMHTRIRRELHKSVSDAAAHITILYGGSVNAKNSAELLQAHGVDGLLVGGASLDATSWAAICET
jgi:triosephosphate isomerase (TIM)